MLSGNVVVREFPVGDALLELQLPPGDLDVIASTLPEDGKSQGESCKEGYCPREYCASNYSSD